jgi:hypothetical protein
MKGRGFWSIIAASLAVLAALIAGCGSSDSNNSSSSSADTAAAVTSETTGSSSTSSGPLTKDEFAKQATQICHVGLREKDKNVVAALKNLPPNSAAGATPEAAGKLVALAVLPVYNEIIDQLGELSAPKSDEAAVNLIVQKYDAAMQAAEADPSSALNNNPFEAGDRAAEAYGIRDCTL